MIRLEDNWVIEVDSNCYILHKFVKTTVDKTGKSINVYAEDKYFGNLKQAIMAYIRVSTRDLLKDKDLSLTEALKTVDERLKHIEEMLNDILRERGE